VLIVLKSGSLILLDPSGPVQACNGIVLPFYLTYFIQLDLFLFLELGFTARRATKTSRMKPSSRSANAKTVSNHSCLWSSLRYWNWEWSLIYTYLLMLHENSPVISKCLSLYVLLSSSEFIFSLIFYYLTTFSLWACSIKSGLIFIDAFLIYIYIYIYIYMYIWNGNFLIGHMFVSFDWLLCCIIGRLLLVGSLIEKWFAYIGLLLLYFYFWFMLLPISQSDFMYLSPWPVFFSWFALVKQAYICLFVAWFCWFRILEQHLFAQ